MLRNGGRRWGSGVVSGSGDKTVKVWDAVTGQLEHTIEHSAEVKSVAIHGNLVTIAFYKPEDDGA